MAMKFGVQATQSGVTWEELLSLWQELDRDSNFDHLWLMDHFVAGAGTAADSSGPCMEGWTALAALAQATERVRLGMLVTGNTYRHPAVLAKEVAQVDIISGGRFELGIGAGWKEDEWRGYGYGFPTLGDRTLSGLRAFLPPEASVAIG